MTRLIYRSEIFREDELSVGLCPGLDASSSGDSPPEAQESLQEAVEAFSEGCKELGSFEEVLTESGYILSNDIWNLREWVSEGLEATIV